MPTPTIVQVYANRLLQHANDPIAALLSTLESYYQAIITSESKANITANSITLLQDLIFKLKTHTFKFEKKSDNHKHEMTYLYHLLTIYREKFKDEEIAGLLDYVKTSIYSHIDSDSVQDVAIPPRPLHNMLERKGFPQDLFSLPHAIILSDDIEKHAAWAFEYIYKIRMSDYHGIQHVSRTAFYIPVVANLYRADGDHEALALTDADLKLLQITALFHDAAREGEGKDYWDNESAVMLYHYLYDTLKVSHNTAVKYAETIANKDPHTDGYYEFIKNDQGTLQFRVSPKRMPNIHSRILQTADSLDIIRARNFLDIRFTSYYQDSGFSHLQTLACLITEVRSLVEKHGDGRLSFNRQLKQAYQHAQCYAKIMAESDNYELLHKLNANNQLIPTNELSSLTLLKNIKYNHKRYFYEGDNLRFLLDEGLIFSRGIGTPSELHEKEKEIKSGSFETKTQLEFRKVARRKGVPTTSSKQNNTQKSGNPKRSVSMLGYGAIPFSSAGLLIVKPLTSHLNQVHVIDAGTGYAKKNYDKNELQISRENIDTQLTQLRTCFMLGGRARRFTRSIGMHNELLMHLHDFDAVYYTLDPTFYNIYEHQSYGPAHHYAPILQAIYIQQQYALENSGMMLPLIEYSGIHNTIKHVDNIGRNEIIRMWVAVCTDYIKLKLADPYSKIKEAELNSIKSSAVYGISSHNIMSPDINYDSSLKKAINDAINEVKQSLFQEHDRQYITRILSEGLQPKDFNLFFTISLDAFPHASGKVITREELIARVVNDKNINMKDKLNNTLLQYALLLSDPEIVALLLKMGAKLDAENIGESILRKRYKNLAFLLNNTAISYEHIKKIIHLAAQSNDIEDNLLLCSALSMLLSNPNNKTLLEYVFESGQLWFINLILNQINFSDYSVSAMHSVLATAIAYESRQLVELAINHLGTLNINIPRLLNDDKMYYLSDLPNTSLLDFAIRNKMNDVVLLFLSVGAKPSDVNVAINAYNPEAIRYLHQFKGDVYRNDCNSKSLHSAAYHNSIECGKVLIELGADINVNDWEKETPLHVSAKKANKEFVKLLLQHGADENGFNSEGKSPLDLCCDMLLRYCNNKKLLLLSRETNAYIDTLACFFIYRPTTINQLFKNVENNPDYNLAIILKHVIFSREIERLESQQRIELFNKLFTLLIEFGFDLNKFFIANDEDTPHLLVSPNLNLQIQTLFTHGVNPSDSSDASFKVAINDDNTCFLTSILNELLIHDQLHLIAKENVSPLIDVALATNNPRLLALALLCINDENKIDEKSRQMNFLKSQWSDVIINEILAMMKDASDLSQRKIIYEQIKQSCIDKLLTKHAYSSLLFTDRKESLLDKINKLYPALTQENELVSRKLM